jgi:hypothetical protein
VKLTAHERQPWPKGYKRYRSLHGCVRNASLLAWEHPGRLRLAKGYAKAPLSGHWLGHWWCVDEQDRVVDPTWKNNGAAYVSVELLDPHEHARATVDEGFWEVGLPIFAPVELEEALERTATEHLTEGSCHGL